MAERGNMPIFVPRTVAALERAATLLARRVAAPVRTIGARALSFADRVVGSWTGAHSPTASGFVVAGERPPMRAAERGGYGMVMPRPWYEVAAETSADVEDETISAAASQPRSAPAATPLRVTPAADRGASIPRTALTAPPEVVERSSEAPASAPPRRTTSTPPTSSAQQPTVTTQVAPAAERPSAQDVTATSSSGISSVTEADVRVVEALGLREFAPAPPPMAVVPTARPSTPLARALSHTAWVDAQLRAVTTPVEQPRTTGSYVFVAPAEVERAPMPAGRAVGAPLAPVAAPRPTPAAPISTSAPVSQSVMSPAAPTYVPPAVATSAFSAALPDPRLLSTLPPMAQRVAEFVARLVGVQSAFDAAPLPAAPVATAIAPPPLSARVPARSFVTAAPERPPTDAPAAVAMTSATASPAVASTNTTAAPRTIAPVVASTYSPAAPAASWRPGAIAARFEQLGAAVDARVSAAWGATSTTPARAVATISPTYVTSAPEPQVRAATGPARMSEFMDKLVGVQAIRATAPLSLQSVQSLAPVAAVAATEARSPAGASLRAPARVALQSMMAVTPAEKAAQALLTPAPQSPRGEAVATMAPGGIGLRAEQMGGIIGVRAASLSIDFVDPARLAMLSGAAPSMTTVTPAPDSRAETTTTPTPETIMPAPRPLFAASPAVSVASRALTAEEWSLVATFPSTATAVQMVTARHAAEWQELASMARATSVGPQTLLTATPEAATRAESTRAESTRVESTRSAATTTRFDAPMIGARSARPAPPAPGRDAARAEEPRTMAAAARGGAPREYVAPSLPTVRSVQTVIDASAARLPGGRTPRGSFTWPKLAEFTSAVSDFSTPAAVTVAEQAAQAGPGVPMWGAMPALITVSPTLAASNAAGEAPGASGATTLVTMAPARGATTASGGTAARADLPSMTLMTAAATREARVALRATGSAASGESDGRSAPMTLTGGAVEATRIGGAASGDGLSAANGGVSNVRTAQSMPLTANGAGQANGAGPTGPAARALELARPFLRMVDAAVGGDGARSAAPRFYEQPQPLVSGAPSNDSATRMVEALRSQPAATPSDDRVTLADLTLISIASATQQVAASAAGGGPSSASSSGGAPSGAGEGGAAAGGGGKSGNPAQEIEELARAAFDELQRLITIARERSGGHG
ncbi:MAG: hypothetical protein JWN44_156 [Myxococcales bacterium]|nr:hypothetical protein [Myxococcales bacterium]